jgi:hypothetical protein
VGSTPGGVLSLRREVARQAYVWGRPTVHLYGILHELVMAPERRGGGNHLDRLVHGAHPVGMGGPVGPRPSGSSGCGVWLDLRRGPLYVESVPDATFGRPTVATLLDLYANVVGTVPEEPGAPTWPYVLTGPSWDPPRWADAAAVVRCPTDLCLAVVRSPGGEDLAEAGLRHETLRVIPCTLGASGPSPLPPPVPPVDVRRPPTMAFLRVLDWILALMPTRPGEEQLRADLPVIGVTDGPGALDEAVAEDQLDGEITRGLELGFEEVRGSGRTSWPPLYRRVR